MLERVQYQPSHPDYKSLCDWLDTGNLVGIYARRMGGKYLGIMMAKVRGCEGTDYEVFVEVDTKTKAITYSLIGRNKCAV